MKSYFHSSIYKKFTRFAITLLSGHASMRSMILVCAGSALIILAYVSTQIYAAKTLDTVSDLKQRRTVLLDSVNQLTGDYAAISSRSKVIDYCETKLGMVKAEDSAVIRIAIDEGNHDLPVLAHLPANAVWSQVHLAEGNTDHKVMR
jgi:hypothetical protein